jgi:hypothetical protein
MRDGQGFLTIWSDIPATEETDYLHWLTREHTAERVGCEGFLAVRVYRALAPEPRRYLICYELARPEAVDGPDYVRRLDHPTPWTQRIMPKLGEFRRGGGRVAAAAGLGDGAFAVALRLATVPGEAAALLRGLAQADRVTAARLCVTDPARTGVKTTEKRLRDAGGDDTSFAAVLQVEALDEAALRAAVARLPEAIRPAPERTEIYRQVFALDRRAL